jgi:hypothetical protein
MARPASDGGTDQAALSTLCTTDVPTPTVRPIFRMPMPVPLSSRMRASTAGLTGAATELDALLPGFGKAGIDPFDDDGTLEFREDSEHLIHGAAGTDLRMSKASAKT